MNIIVLSTITIILIIILYFLDKNINIYNNNKNNNNNIYNKINNNNINHNVDNYHENEYDYIIIGAGAAGCIVTARLGEDKNLKILLLESGHDNSMNSKITSNYDKEISFVPIKDGIYLKRYHNNPSILKCDGLEASPSLTEYMTTKQKERYFVYPRGNGAGGSTNHHSMYDGRGCQKNYDRIAKEVNDPIWSSKNILQYWKKMESYNVPNANLNIHGNKGWLQVEKNGKLNSDLKMEMIQIFNDDFGVPFRHDPSDPSQVSGVYISEQQVNKNGLRSNSFENLLNPMIKKNKNITLKYNCLVKNIIIENKNNKLKAKGVVVYEKPYIEFSNITGNKINYNNCNAEIPDKSLPKPIKYFAKKEVIICSGAIGTPQLLMLSGIGNKNHLKEKGINTIINLPGVGENLADHPFCTIGYELDPKKIMWEWQATYLKNNTDYKNLSSPEIIKSIEKFYNPNSNFNNAMGLGYDMPTGLINSSIEEPDVHVQIANRFFFDPHADFKKFPKGDNYQQKEHEKDSWMPNRNNPINVSNGVPNSKPYYINSQMDPTNPRVFISFLLENIFCKPTGSIKLKDSDPRSSPLINLGYWKDKLGTKRLATCILKLREYMNSPGMLKYTKYPNEPYKNEIWPGPNCKTLEQIMEYLENWQLYGYHIGCTAKMGNNNDPMAVVDSKLKVKGIEGLRIADLSVYPPYFLHAYNTSRGAYLIGEIASDIIKNDNKYK